MNLCATKSQSVRKQVPSCKEPYGNRNHSQDRTTQIPSDEINRARGTTGKATSHSGHSASNFEGSQGEEDVEALGGGVDLGEHVPGTGASPLALADFDAGEAPKERSDGDWPACFAFYLAQEHKRVHASRYAGGVIPGVA